MRDKAGQLQKAAAEARDRLNQQPQDREALQRHLEQMNRDLAKFREQVARLNRRLDEAASGASDEQKMQIARLRKALERLELSVCQSCQMPGRTADEQQVNGAEGMGGWNPSGRLGQWVDQISTAAVHDIELLDGEQEGMQMLIPTTTDVEPSQDTKTGDEDVKVEGATVHRDDTGGDYVDTSDAALSDVPEAYRDLVRRYLKRVATDQQEGRE